MSSAPRSVALADESNALTLLTRGLSSLLATQADAPPTKQSDSSALVEQDHSPPVNFLLPRSGIVTFFAILHTQSGLASQQTDTVEQRQIKNLIRLVLSCCTLQLAAMVGTIYSSMGVLVNGSFCVYCSLSEKQILKHTSEEYYDNLSQHLYKLIPDALLCYSFTLTLLTSVAFFFFPKLFLSGSSALLGGSDLPEHVEQRLTIRILNPTAKVR